MDPTTGHAPASLLTPANRQVRLAQTFRSQVAAAGLLAIGLAITPGLARGAGFQGLGFLPGGNFGSSAFGVSANGQVVVGATGPGGDGGVFRWTSAEGMQRLGSPSGEVFASYARSLSSDGSIVVGTSSDLAGEGFLWTREGGLQSLSELVGGGVYFSTRAISDDGTTIVGGASFEDAFRFVIGQGIQSLGGLGAQPLSFGNANDVSADGNVVVGTANSPNRFQEAFRWTPEEGMQGLGDLPGGSYSTAWGVSADGRVVVGAGRLVFDFDPFSTGDRTTGEAFRWTPEEGIQGLGHLPGGLAYSAASDVNGDGSTIVGISTGANGNVAFIWDAAHGMRSLQEVLITQFGLGGALDGWLLESANAITPDGQYIVGSGINPSGNREAWIAQLASASPVPLPATVSMFALACAVVSPAARRRIGGMQA